MATVLPFRAVRPDSKVADQVAALPYDVYTRESAKQYVVDKPLSFLNIDRPETQFPDGYDIYAPEVYQKANQLLQQQRHQKIYIQDHQKHYYVYELTMQGRRQTGIVALSSIDDYINDVCRKHENTIEEKELDRINHVDVCSAQTGPIFLAYRAQRAIDRIVREVKKHQSIFNFVADDGIRHRGWKVSEEQTDAIMRAFEKVKCTYIADGHHRAMSAVKVGLKRRAAHPDYDGTEEFNYFLSVLFPDNQLKIMDYNRFVKDLNGLTEEEFFNQLSESFIVNELHGKRHPLQKFDVTMYLHHKWYLLRAKPEVIELRVGKVVEQLDTSLLQDVVLKPILGISDPRTDKRIQFVGGIEGLDGLTQRVNGTVDGVAFAMYPTSIQELFEVADAHLLMPPKSTWFEPKIRSGLFIHEIER